MSFKPEFKCQGEWCDNAQRFATYNEALASAKSRFMRWTVPSGIRATESSDPVNYKWDDDQGDCMVNRD